MRVCSAFVSDDSEKLDEEHHDINVDEHRANYILVVGQAVLVATGNQLCVVDQIEAINDHKQGANKRVPPGCE